jgi:hypothetical protein
LAHAARDQIKAMIANVLKGLDTILASSPQLIKLERWKALARQPIFNMVCAQDPGRRPQVPDAFARGVRSGERARKAAQ